MTPDTKLRLLDELGSMVTELVDRVDTVEEIPDWRPLGASSNERRVWRTTAPGLLTQLATGPAGLRHAVKRPEYGQVDASWLLVTEADGAAPPDTSGHEKPDSRPPTDLQTIDVLADIAAGVESWLRRLGASDEVLDRDLPARIRWLPQAVAQRDESMLRKVIRDVRSWVRTARLLLNYDAPSYTIRDVTCPECNGLLRAVTGEGDKSVVRCVGGLIEGPAQQGERWPLRVEGCGVKWPRGQWSLMLDSLIL